MDKAGLLQNLEKRKSLQKLYLKYTLTQDKGSQSLESPGTLDYVIISDVTTGEILKLPSYFSLSGLEAGGIEEFSESKMALESMWAPQAAVIGDGPSERVGEQGSPHTQVLQTASLKDGPAKRAVWVRRNHSEPETTTSPEVKKPKLELTKAVVVDLGTGYCKCGFAGLPKPTHRISTTVGKP